MKIFLALLAIATVVLGANLDVIVDLDDGVKHFQCKHRRGPPLKTNEKGAGCLTEVEDGWEGAKATQIIEIVSVNKKYQDTKPNQDPFIVSKLKAKVQQWSYNNAKKTWLRNGGIEEKSKISLKGKLVDGHFKDFTWNTT